MSSTRDIKQRIANVNSVEKIIKAMYMVASTRLAKVRRQLEGVRPIYGELKRIAEELGCQEDASNHIFYEERKVENSLYVIFSSDGGLSGSYNANILKETLKHMNQGKQEKILIVGAKGHDYLKNKNKNIVRTVVDVADSHVYYGSENLADWLADYYLSGEVEEVFIAYTQFKNVLSQEPRIEKLLPIATGAIENSDNMDKKYEPNMEAYIDNVIPLYLHMSLFRAFSEAHTSEQAVRMVNMDSSGKNATELVEELTRMYNRKRQAAITQELSEIVGAKF